MAEIFPLLQGMVGIGLLLGGFIFKDEWLFALGAVMYLGAGTEFNR